MTRAVLVVVERSPGGGNGWAASVGEWRWHQQNTTVAAAICAALNRLGETGATPEELLDVVEKLGKTLRWRPRAEVAAMVPADSPQEVLKRLDTVGRLATALAEAYVDTAHEHLGRPSRVCQCAHVLGEHEGGPCAWCNGCLRFVPSTAARVGRS